MKYFVIAFLLIVSVYPLGYIKYVWQKKNYFGAIGMVFLTLFSISFPAYLIIVR